MHRHRSETTGHFGETFCRSAAPTIPVDTPAPNSSQNRSYTLTTIVYITAAQGIIFCIEMVMIAKLIEE